MAWLAARLGRAEGVPEQWYSVTQEEVKAHHGAGLLKRYGNSPQRLLAALYPHQRWLPWLFPHTPKAFWARLDNQRRFLDWLGSERLGVRERSDWYRVTAAEVAAHQGAYLITRTYRNSLYALLRHVYPDYDWLPWLFATVPNGFWLERAHRQRYVLWLQDHLGLASAHELSAAQLEQHRGGALLKSYGGSVAALLADAFPEQRWPPWLFKKVAASTWDSAEARAELMQQCETRLHLRRIEDWHRVSLAHLQDIGLARFVRQAGGLAHLLSQRYPDHRWDALRADMSLTSRGRGSGMTGKGDEDEKAEVEEEKSSAE